MFYSVQGETTIFLEKKLISSSNKIVCYDQTQILIHFNLFTIHLKSSAVIDNCTIFWCDDVILPLPNIYNYINLLFIIEIIKNYL